MWFASALVLLAFAVVSACGAYWWLLNRITPAPPPPARRDPPALGAESWVRLRGHVDFLTAEPRNFRALGRLAHIVEYLSGEFRKAGGRVWLQPYAIPLKEDGESVARTYKNVVARFGAVHAHGSPAPPVVVIGAHYDSCGDTPGADDNASGVATLLEIARLLGAREQELRRAGAAVELVAYFGEEPPFFAGPYMGSVKHAEHVRSTYGSSVLGVIVLEMVGYFSDEPGSQSYPWGLSQGLRIKYGDVGDFIGVVGRQGQEAFVMAVHSAMQAVSGLKVHSLAAPQSLGGVDLSDHRSYWARGYEAVMVTDTAFHRNPHYHKKTDAADTLDYPRMAIVGEQVAAAALALAQRAVPALEDHRDALHAPALPRPGARLPRLLDGRV